MPKETRIARDDSPLRPGKAAILMNLKEVLTVLGNRLVKEWGFHPGYVTDSVTIAPIIEFINWLNRTPEAHKILAEMGIEWPETE